MFRVIREWFVRCMVMVILVSASVVAVTAPSHAVGTYANGTIADIALSYVGQWGGNACRDAGKSQSGQCKQFVNCIVFLASGGTQWTVDPGQNYQNSYSGAGGVEVTLADTVKGDIMQLGQVDADAITGNLHTAIVVENKGDGTLSVVDSNYGYDEMVQQHNYTPKPGERFWRMATVASSPSGDPTANGKFVSYHGAVYRIAGGAPLYVSGHDAQYLSEWATAVPIDDGQWASLRSFPADGTYINDVITGAVYVTVGGAPMYISGNDAPYLSNWAHATRVPHWDFENWQHLRQYPADGYYLRDVQSGFVYNTAGGAAFYIASPDAPALPQWQYASPVPHWELVNHQHLRTIPADGAYISDVQTGMTYITLGGAPMYISGDDAPYLPNWAGATRVSHWEFDHWSSLRPLPADGYYLRDVQTGQVFVTAGGAPLYVSPQDGNILTQWQYASPIPHWELQNRNHLRQYPADNTYIRGVPSGEVFQMVGGVAVRVTSNPLPAATNVDDWAIVNQLGGTL